MLNTISVILLSFILASCSKSNEAKQAEKIQDEQENVIELAPLELKSIAEASYQLLPQPGSALNFGSLEYGQVVEQKIIIRNPNTMDLVFSSSDIDASQIAPFQLVSDSCSSSTIKRGKICIVSMRLLNDSELAENVDLSKSLIIKNININLTGTQINRQAPPLIPVTGYIVGPLHLDFGDMKSGEKKDLTVLVSNKGSQTVTFTSSAPANAKFSVLNNCPATIQSRKSCSLKFSYTASSDETVNAANLVSLSSNQLSFSVIVASPTVNNPEVSPLVQPLIASTTISITEPDSSTGVIQFKNNGSSTLAGPISAVASNPGIILSTPTCSGGLARGKTCSVNYTLNSAALPAGFATQTVSLRSGTKSSTSHSLNITKISEEEYSGAANYRYFKIAVADAWSGYGADGTSSYVSLSEFKLKINGIAEDMSPYTYTSLNGSTIGGMSTLKDNILEVTNAINYTYWNILNGSTYYDLFKVDLSSIKNVTDVMIAPQGTRSNTIGAGYNMPKKFKIFGSNDESSWTEVLNINESLAYNTWNPGEFRTFPIADRHVWTNLAASAASASPGNLTSTGGGWGAGAFSSSSFANAYQDFTLTYNVGQRNIGLGEPEVMIGFEPVLPTVSKGLVSYGFYPRGSNVNLRENNATFVATAPSEFNRHNYTIEIKRISDVITFKINGVLNRTINYSGEVYPYVDFYNGNIQINSTTFKLGN